MAMDETRHPLSITEILQNVLDGLMMVIAVGIFNFINPLYLLPKRTSWKGFH
jgi:hypothetical protein